MSHQGFSDIEILVHAAAPSLGRDDSRYRALATGYVRFTPASSITLISKGVGDRSRDVDQDVTSQRHHGLSQAEVPSQSSSCQEELAPWIDSQESYYEESEMPVAASRTYMTRSFHRSTMDSPSLSFRSAIDNGDSPPLPDLPGFARTSPPQELQALHDEITEETTFYGSWPSVVEDSQETYDKAIREFSSPGRILELYLQQLDCQESVPSATDLENVNLQVVPGAELQVTAHALVATSSTDVVPETERTKINLRNLDFKHASILSTPTELVPETERVKSSAKKRDIDEFSGHKTKRLRSTGKTPTATYTSTCPVPETPCRPRSNLIESNVLSNATPLPSSSIPASVDPVISSLSASKRLVLKRRAMESPSGCSVSRSVLQVLGSSPPQMPETPSTLPRKRRQTIIPNSAHIHPPPPPTSVHTHSLSTFTGPTPALAKVREGLHLARSSYPAAIQSRKLRSKERGYWRFDTSAWPSETQNRAWYQLRKFVEEGKAGWGVWCSRDGDDDSVSLNTKAEIWRVYCWGGIVEHIWFLIHLISERKVKKFGATWVDADGDVVVSLAGM